MFTILYQARVSGQNPKVTNDSLCDAIFSVFGDDFTYCGSTAGHGYFHQYALHRLHLSLDGILMLRLYSE